MQITDMTKKYADLISEWKYDGIYSFYDHNKDNIDDFMNGKHFACTDMSGELIGYFCFGEDARIPTIEENVYDDDFIDIGLSLKPNLCGNNLGLSFLNEGLKYAGELYNTSNFCLSVASFNERAIKVYKRAGFYVEREVTNSYFNNKFFIMKYT